MFSNQNFRSASSMGARTFLVAGEASAAIEGTAGIALKKATKPATARLRSLTWSEMKMSEAMPRRNISKHHQRRFVSRCINTCSAAGRRGAGPAGQPYQPGRFLKRSAAEATEFRIYKPQVDRIQRAPKREISRAA